MDLDLSWNELGMMSMLKIAEALSHNRKLQHVNLSWNFLNRHAIEKFDRLDVDEEQQAADARQRLLRMKILKQKSAEFYFENVEMERKIHEYLLNKDPALTPQEYAEKLEELVKRKDLKNNFLMVQYLTTFIKRNKDLIHLNLD